MSVHKRNGKWQVKWKQGGGARSRTFDRKSDADLFDREIKRRKALGPTLVGALDREAMTLAEFVAGLWRSHALELAVNTRKGYAWVLNNHLLELLDEPLVTIDVPMLAAHQRLLLDRGLRPRTVSVVMMRLGGILQLAAEHGLIAANPARSLRKVRVERREPVRPYEPVELERLIAASAGIDRAIIVLGGYLGLRPIEWRQVSWETLDGNRLTIDADKTKPAAARSRTIDVPQAAAAELRAWRLESGGRGDTPIIGMTVHRIHKWNPKLQALSERVVGRRDVTAYTLRHTQASLLHYANYTIPEAAERMGHSELKHMETYAHPMRTLRGKRYDDLDAAIAAARAQLAELEFPAGSPKVTQTGE